ncbi:EAL domain-containing protein [Sphingomonas sp.]|uniref:EAL domain-containing protein n=2 Tax=unclassified Sphingomonas TaxID=196159 RepID=UPI000B03D29D
MNMSDEFSLLQRNERLSAFLRLGLQEEMFRLNYQDIHSLINDRTAAREALLRWGGSDQAIPCDVETLFDVAETTGRIVELGGKIIDWACRDAAKWADRCAVAVNVSPHQLLAGDFAAQTFDALARHNLPAERLHLEITENAMLVPTREVVEQLRLLRHAGVSLSLDDFGSGYSSLRNLQRFSFDAIKLDRCFASHAPYDYKSREILSAVAALGERLGIHIIAEGVETHEQLDLVRAAGFSHAQGFLFSHPRGQEEVLDNIARDRARREVIRKAEIIDTESFRRNWRISAEAKVIVGGFRRDAPPKAPAAADKPRRSGGSRRSGGRRPPPLDESAPSPPAG